MSIQVILIASIIIQFIAAFYALRLLKLTGVKYSWLFISTALLLMVSRRAISLYNLYNNQPGYVNFSSELIGLILSLCMLIGIYGIGPIFIERTESEQKIKKLLSDKETLIRELYHRTKNTMQVIRGLLTLQAAEYSSNEDMQKLVDTTNNRIEAMSLVHQKLYQSNDLSKISIRDYIEDLSNLIIHNYTDSKKVITLNITADESFFLLDIAIPIGLIINELITNSLKYAFPDRHEGIISIRFNRAGPEKNILTYADNGIGVDDSFNFRERGTLGLMLLHQIVEQQLMGSVEMRGNNGIYCSIEFNDKIYSRRV